jgi:hypothetical protein
MRELEGVDDLRDRTCLGVMLHIEMLVTARGPWDFRRSLRNSDKARTAQVGIMTKGKEGDRGREAEKP